MSESEDILSGGRWVPDQHGILRWQQIVEAVPEPIPLHDLIACPTCRARLDEMCRTSSGAGRASHSTRLVPRLCSCGSLLKPYRRLCDECGAESSRASKLAHVRRRRAAERKAS